jgi:CheY-like chemotaxis protein
MQILVVDDDATVRMVLVDMLHNWGYDACAVSDGKAALEYLGDAENEKPQLILLDYMMPVMNGEQFLTLREQVSWLKKIPVVVFTGSTDMVKMRLAEGYVQKPFVRDVQPFVEKFCTRTLE